MESTKNFELIRRAVTQISTGRFKNDSRIPMDFVMLKDWACLDGESEEHIDFKLPRIINICDVRGKGNLYIHRATEIEKTRIKTKDGDVEVHTMNLNDDEIVKLIRGFVREAYEHERVDSTKEDYWENIEEKISVVSEYLINTYATEYCPSDEAKGINAMEKRFGEKYCIESRSDIESLTSQEFADLAQKKPYLLIFDRRFSDVLPISEEKKADYSKGLWDVRASLSWNFDEKSLVNQIVFLQPKK